MMKKLNPLHMSVVFTAVMLAGVTSAAAQVVLEFPLHANDLNSGERVVIGVHDTAGGPQTGAKDLRILRRVKNNDWRVLKEGAHFDSINSNYLIYKRNVYAMAGGTVVACWRNAPENDGHIQQAGVTSGKILLQGNHLWIKQTDGNYALYAHAPTGDIPASLCPNNNSLLTGTALPNATWLEPEAVVTNGATITAGQLLFHVGNSGHSSEPHLHIHVVNAQDQWKAMRFARGQTTRFNNGTASLNGPWDGLKGRSLPLRHILIWPPHPIGTWVYNDVTATAYQRVFDHFVDSGEMPDTVSCKNNGATYDTTWVPAQGLWILEINMSNYDHLLKNAKYTKEGYKETSVYTCGSITAAIWRKP